MLPARTAHVVWSDEYKGGAPEVVVVGTYWQATACGLVSLEVGDEYLTTSGAAAAVTASPCDAVVA